jgi:hypothetical protein
MPGGQQFTAVAPAKRLRQQSVARRKLCRCSELLEYPESAVIG